MTRWQDWVNLVLGVWLILSPWLLGFSGLTNATWNAILVGILVGALALSVARERPKAT
ncbi:MAG: SPW repeat protein [Thermus sp.]